MRGLYARSNMLRRKFYFVVSYNNSFRSFRILRSLPMRCSASAMFASSNVDTGADPAFG